MGTGKYNECLKKNQKNTLDLISSVIYPLGTLYSEKGG